MTSLDKYETMTLKEVDEVFAVTEYLSENFRSGCSQGIRVFMEGDNVPAYLVRTGHDKSFINLDPNHPRFEELKKRSTRISSIKWLDQ